MSGSSPTVTLGGSFRPLTTLKRLLHLRLLMLASKRCQHKYNQQAFKEANRTYSCTSRRLASPIRRASVNAAPFTPDAEAVDLAFHEHSTDMFWCTTMILWDLRCWCCEGQGGKRSEDGEDLHVGWLLRGNPGVGCERTRVRMDGRK
jgi:hypothetical protein